MSKLLLSILCVIIMIFTWNTHIPFAFPQIKVPEDIKQIQEQLKSEDHDEKEEAVSAIGKLQSEDAISFLIAMLHDDSSYCYETPMSSPSYDKEVGRATEEAIVRVRGKHATELLMNMLKDEQSIARCNAARILGKIGDVNTIGPLINALKDKNEWVRQRAAEALGNIKDPRVANVMIGVMKNEKEWSV